ncbi:radical SAM protein [Catellatospora sp. TT07R-123]|uniref:radical SAM protein n=1 Tax=Catellatospora sp. TT07R-123 TaxID=2733863 RepID=UPI001B0838B0|nr:radical SAM protein [Catellatospora sp. TT07R-123]GHJ45901.1 radical SAM protein [Catellatospora sp. TT07R-123]
MTQELCRFRPATTGSMVIWELTRYCNLACVHCCTDSDPDVPTDRDLPTAAIIEAISDMTACGMREFFFSGGEPFTRKDLVEIISAVDPQQGDVFVNTNGYHVTQELAAQLAGTALRSVTVSIDGATRDVHAILRGKPSSYDRAVRAVGHFVHAGIPVRISHVVAAPNVHQVEDFVHQMLPLGVTGIVVSTMFPAGRAARYPHLLLNEQQTTDLEIRLSALRAVCAENGVELDYSLGDSPVTEEGPRGCPAGSQVFYVSADGAVSGCSWLYKLDPDRYGIGNLHDTPFRQLLDDLRAQNQTFMGYQYCPLPLLTT